ncbi:MAG: DNA mismatch repair endonuclease MutL [bacterium]
MSEARSRIHILDPAVARKIAAGEVIERPAGVVRELLDNSLDAGATRIEVELTAGGTELIRVVDDGHGMVRDDLERAVLPHSTSKITTDDDLLHVRTLGFRGEALSSVAAVSRLEITSAPLDGTPHRLRVEAGRVVALEPAPGAPGTSVAVADLFANVPARKRFLKRPGSEFATARSVFLDKALPFPDVEFRLTANGEPRSILPRASLVERIAAAYPQRTEPALLHEIEASGDGFRAVLIAGEPTSPRKDRKGLQVFVNRRRVWEYALVQAVEYAYRDYLHGGLYPVAYLFLEVEPELVDFNIHPAKREVRFRNLPEIHRRVVAALSNYLRVFDRRAASSGEALPFGDSQVAETPTGTRVHGSGRPDAVVGSPGGITRAPDPAGRAAFDLSRVFDPGAANAPDAAARETDSAAATPDEAGFRYLGQIMGLFLVVERGDRLYLVDQHAAHERIIYDRLRAGAGGQELLFPVRLEVDAGAEQTLRGKREELRRLGIEVDERDGGWELLTVPSSVSIEAESLAALLMDLLDQPSDFERELYASLSCRSAVKDGDALAPQTAVSIVRGVMGLENARCPHGRPLWAEFSRDQLASIVGRT